MDPIDATPETLEFVCRRLKASDRSAFEQVFRLFRDDLLRYVRSVVRREDVANDLVQDVFVSLWETRETLDPSLPLKGYLYRMSRNAAYRYLRDSKTHMRKHAEIKRMSAAARTNGTGHDLAVRDGSFGDRLRAWIDELPSRQREALVLSRFHDLSHREIASVMEISPRTVNNHIMRALEHLHERIRAYEPALLES